MRFRYPGFWMSQWRARFYAPFTLQKQTSFDAGPNLYDTAARAMSSLAINAVAAEVKESAEFCRTEGLGLEVSTFAYPENLEGDTAPLIEWHRDTVSDIAPLVSHGPFLDLVATSRDPAIVAVARKRHEAALSASKQIGVLGVHAA